MDASDLEKDKMKRSEFLKNATKSLVALGACPAIIQLFTACGGSPKKGGSSTSGGGLTIDITKYPSLGKLGGAAEVSEGGGLIVVNVDGKTALAFKTKKACPHAQGDLKLSGNQIQCKLHGGKFDLKGVGAAGDTYTGGKNLEKNMFTATVSDNTISISGL